VVEDVVADSVQAAPAELEHLLGDPRQAQSALGTGKAQHIFEGAYRDIVSLPSAVAGRR
jgi:protein-tyrosine phosphatase